MANKFSNEDFINRATQIHGSRYDYTKSEYTVSREPVIIGCPTHGDFMMSPNHHISRKRGCQKCAGMHRPSTDEFIKRAVATHGDTYVYDKAIYKNGKEKTQIYCKTHGYFWQAPQRHVAGQGCRKCADQEKAQALSYKTSDFIERAVSIHGFKYNYSESSYLRGGIKVKIICEKHGAFWQTANSHLNGSGCRQCYLEDAPMKQRFSTGDFIKKSSAIHGVRYCYDNSEYITNSEKVRIDCKEHGPFYQLPVNHWRGCGCPSCPHDFASPCTVYIKSSLKNGVKVGVAMRPLERLKTLIKNTPFSIKTHSFVTCKNTPSARAVESEIHRRIKSLNCGYTGFDGATEWFNIDPKEAIKLVKQVVKDMDVAA